MVEVRWLISAKSDLQSIYDYISLDSNRYAILQIERIVSRTEILKNQPKIGKIVEELNNHEIRELIEGNYRIIYRTVNSIRIDVIMIHHAARDLRKRNIE